MERKCVDCGLESDNLSLFERDFLMTHGRRNLCLTCSTIRSKKRRAAARKRAESKPDEVFECSMCGCKCTYSELRNGGSGVICLYCDRKIVRQKFDREWRPDQETKKEMFDKAMKKYDHIFALVSGMGLNIDDPKDTEEIVALVERD